MSKVYCKACGQRMISHTWALCNACRVSKWKKDHPEAWRAIQYRYRDKFPEKYKEIQRKAIKVYYSRHPEKMKEHSEWCRKYYRKKRLKNFLDSVPFGYDGYKPRLEKLFLDTKLIMHKQHFKFIAIGMLVYLFYQDGYSVGQTKLRNEFRLTGKELSRSLFYYRKLKYGDKRARDKVPDLQEPRACVIAGDTQSK